VFWSVLYIALRRVLDLVLLRSGSIEAARTRSVKSRA